MNTLDQDQIAFLHACARYGPTDCTSLVGKALERRGYVEFVYEGDNFQGRWRLTREGRDAAQNENNSTRRILADTQVIHGRAKMAVTCQH